MSDKQNVEGVRLQKVLARAGVASRRGAEELIAQGRVSVDGEVVREQGRRVDPERAVIKVDGRRIEVRSGMVYLALNKPVGVHTTMRDQRGRKCVGDFVRDRPERLFHVGRLDADTEGLLLLTNDGELAHRLMHPSFHVLKTYLAEVDGAAPRSLGKRLRAGIELDDGPVAVDGYKEIQKLPGRTLVEVVLHEGRNRIVRRMFAAVGHPVRRLVRTAIADIRLGDLKPGTMRELTPQEISSLHTVLEQ
ncbi:MAG: pseudouridine synthase [Thermocrispum agreste]|jgi:23S rRNA pseudouridine2605 synthase|uniref:Pseudouridine synthase n=1 Tax=Thermocrispum agreste TaxID=37925 RepID=A0A2W4JRU4_9PSEU|nr:MAG: pseudouridine synthase [Thermocrispum agreste]